MAHNLKDMPVCKKAGTDECPIVIELGEEAKVEYGKYPEVIKKRKGEERQKLRELAKKCEQMLSGHACPYLFAEKGYQYPEDEEEKKRKKKAAEKEGYQYPEDKKKKAEEAIDMKRLEEMEERVKKLEELNKALAEANKQLQEKIKESERKLFEEQVNKKCQEYLDKGYWPAMVDKVKEILLNSRDMVIKLEDNGEGKPMMDVIDELLQTIPESVLLSYDERTHSETTKPGEPAGMTLEEVEEWAKKNGLSFEEACARLAKEGKIQV